jgi:2-amino-4-hydroxy-6-hydroxymethyldihydropteridine diphosphokinase
VSAQRRAVVGLGSNVGDRRASLDAATARLARLDATTLVARSPVYETDPVGGPPQGAYLNAAALLRTALEPRALLDHLLAIEADLGRVRDGTRDAPRTIDLDLLWIEGVALEEEGLEVPHPRLGDRAFALVPLLDVAPDARDAGGRRFDLRPAAGQALRFVAPAATGDALARVSRST